MSDDIKFCEDCKWYGGNYLPWWEKLSHMGDTDRCLHPKCLKYPIAHRNTRYAYTCEDARTFGSLCGNGGKYYEPKGDK